MKIIIASLRKLKYYVKHYLKMGKLRMFPGSEKSLIDTFHEYYYDSHLQGRGWRDAKFLGIPIQKCPFDLFIYQEILTEIKPDLIIETGTAFGGGALWLATICDALNKGKVISVDITSREDFPRHERIDYIEGSSIAEDVLAKLEASVKDKNTVMVILDSDHSAKHVLQELKLYNKFVTKGSYLIVEDSNVNGNPVYKEHGPGPMEALIEFLKENKDFETDKSREKHFVTFNPEGYLKKIV